MSKDPEIIDVEQTALVEMDRGTALIKIENETMMSMARSHPRNHPAILADIKEQLETYPTFAAQAMFSKPVGKDRNTGQMKYAKGLSIRAAEAIAAAYGYNRCRVDVTPIDNDTARVEASFTDYQSGRVWQAGKVVSKVYTGHDKRKRRHADDRFYDVVCGAVGSKVLRECILRSVAPGLRSELERIAGEQIESFLDESTSARMLAQFSTKGVTQEMLERHVSKKLDAFTKADRATLLGVWNAIEQEEISVAAAFEIEPTAVEGGPGLGNLSETIKARKAAEAAQDAPPPTETPVAAPDGQLLDISGTRDTDPQPKG